MKGNVIDLTLSLAEPMRGYERSIAKTRDQDGWNASTLHLYSHAGTHMDAPVHFDINESGIEDYDPNRFICNCHIIRLAPAEPGMVITVDHLGEVREKIQPGEGILLHTGWSNFSTDPTMYRDKLPRIGEDLALWLSLQEVNLVGVEPPSIADVNNPEELHLIHRILLESDIIIIEGLCNLEKLKQNYVSFIALPLKINAGDGAPVRAIAIETN